MKHKITAVIAGIGLALALSSAGVSQASAVDYTLSYSTGAGSCSATGSIPTSTSTKVVNISCSKVQAGIRANSGGTSAWYYGDKVPGASTITITFTTMISGHNGVLYINDGNYGASMFG